MTGDNAAMRFFADLTTDCHVTKAALRQLLTDSLVSVESGARVRHHLSICRQCRESLAEEALAQEEETEFKDNTGWTKAQDQFLTKLPTLNALLQRRVQHMEELGKLVTPEKIHWMIPSLLEEIALAPGIPAAEDEAAEELKAAAFSGVGTSGSREYRRDLRRVPQFVEEMEEILTNRWNEVQLEEHAMTTLLDECIAASQAASGWPSGIAEQVRNYYLRAMLPAPDEHDSR